MLGAALLAPRTAAAAELGVTVLADFEDESTAARVTSTVNVGASACVVRREAIPARGQHSLALEMGASRPDASAALDLEYRLPARFERGAKAAWVAWINEGQVSIALRIRDDRGRVFESAPQTLRDRRRWVRMSVDLTTAPLQPVLVAAPGPGAKAGEGSDGPAWPIEILGYRIATTAVGRQAVFLDDLEVEHSIGLTEQVRTRFAFDRPTQFYEPGATVRASLELENRSRAHDLRLTITLTWVDSDGLEMKPVRSLVSLPASSANFRSRQTVDVVTALSEPGLYRLTARVFAAGWPSDAIAETAVAVTLSNRGLPRGRSTFFGVHTDLLRQPPIDQQLEIDLAREIGVQLLAVDAPWAQLEPEPGRFDLAALEALVSTIVSKDMAIALLLTEPPAGLSDPAQFDQRQGDLVAAVCQKLGRRVGFLQATAPSSWTSEQRLALRESLQKRAAAINRDAVVLAPAMRLSDQNAADALARAVPQGVVTEGDALLALREFRSRSDDLGGSWPDGSWWTHRGDPPQGLGSPYDATSLLRLYLGAAERGVGAVIWGDLRDASNDARFPQQRRGLVRRDFSPRLGLIGFANTAGLLAGMRYTGKVAGTPDAYESAMFIGADHQVGVLVPRLNRALPALLAPASTVPCELTVMDFERRARPLHDTPLGLWTPSVEGPLFFSLAFEAAQTEDRLVLRRPCVDVPSLLPVRDPQTLRVNVLPPVPLRRSYVQLQAGESSRLNGPWPAMPVRAGAGEAAAVEIPVAWKEHAARRPEPLVLAATLEGTRIDIPLRVAPLAAVRKGTGEWVADENIVGSLRDADGQESPVRVYAAYASDRFQIAVSAPTASTPALELLIGLAVEKGERILEAAAGPLSGSPALRPLTGTDPGALGGWKCRRLERAGAPPALVVEVPAAALGLERLAEGQRLLVALRLRDSASKLDLRWGEGLDGRGTTAGYEWLELAP